jgi:hypothetical protein
MNKISITLSNSNEHTDLVFDLNATRIADKWATEISKGWPIYENWRFTGWPNSEWTADRYIAEIDKCINTVNKYQPGTITLTGQSDLNYLHKFFETLRGGIDDPTPWFQAAPDNVQKAVNLFNILIHNYEKLLNSNHLSPTITCTFTAERHQLEPEDFQYFTYDWKFGTIYINYCEVGKHLLELYIDNDNVVGEHNIRPLQHYSADFKLKFFVDRPRGEFKKFNQGVKAWCKKNSSFFKQLGITELALGLIPVATINYKLSGLDNLTQSEIIDKLSKYSFVSCVKVIK